MTAPHHEELLQAEDMMQRGDYSSALELALDILSDEKISDDIKFHTRLLETRARIKLGKIDEAETSIQEAMDITKNINNPFNDAEILLLKLESMWRRGRIDEGLEIVQDVEDLLSGINQNLSKGDADKILRLWGDLYRHSGILYWYKGELDRAKDYHTQSLDSCVKREDERGIAVSYNNLGLVFWSKGDFDEAASYYEKALEIQNQIGNQYEVSTLLNNLGNVYMLKGEIEKGYELQRPRIDSY